MKKEYLKIAILAAAVCIAGLVLMSAASDPNESRVAALLEKRTDVINGMLYGGITFKEGEKRLQSIESGELYDRDLSSVRSYIDTDVDMVKEMKIIRIERKTNVSDLMTFDATIEWTCGGSDGGYEMTKDYNISVRTSGGEWRLVSFETADT